MALSTYLLLLLTHPQEFRTLLQYKLYHSPSRNLVTDSTSGWERDSMRVCWGFLDQTSRSFAAVIKELEGELARTVCLFYLVLRGLDTIEDDMTLDPNEKDALLRSFYRHTVTPGWSFTGSGPAEKDRELLVQYAAVVDEMNLLPAPSRDAILSIAEKMGSGMADFALRAEGTTVDTRDEYDLYCHYVAGLVGEGLSLLFAASAKEAPGIARQLVLSNSMGLLLQKTNITRDLREDADERRYWYPREFWGPYGFAHPGEMCPASGDEKDVEERALWVQSTMVVDALRHATDALDYLRLLKNQSVFNFCAIPATMAMATLELCFMNRAMFVRNVKIRKAAAADLIMRSTNPREVSLIFRDFARKIHARAIPQDPNFMKIAVACGKVRASLLSSSCVLLVVYRPVSHFSSVPVSRCRLFHIYPLTATHPLSLPTKSWPRAVPAFTSPLSPSPVSSPFPIEQWHERCYPSFVLVNEPGSGGGRMHVNQTDPRGAVFVAQEKAEAEFARRRNVERVRERLVKQGLPTSTLDTPMPDGGNQVLWNIGLIMVSFVLAMFGLVFVVRGYLHST
ncbi:hypothetical protein MKEN_00745500 [Mycena kentingensis (nom. inval.)]|nr:hypothetical protein MKEN_00745500 [Mycena kentingensis (nom. inval.)]